MSIDAAFDYDRNLTVCKLDVAARYVNTDGFDECRAKQIWFSFFALIDLQRTLSGQ